MPITFSGTPGPDGKFHPGSSWKIQITGEAPNTQVTGRVGGSVTPYGNTDANGNWMLQGGFDGSTIGSWAETWYVGDKFVGSWSFIVFPPYVAPPATPPPTPIVTPPPPAPPPQQQTQQTTNTTNTSTTSGSSATGSGTDTSGTTGSLPPVQVAGQSFMDEFTVGLSALVNPQSWGTVIQSGNTGEIVGLLSVPAALLLMVMISGDGGYRFRR